MDGIFIDICFVFAKTFHRIIYVCVRLVWFYNVVWVVVLSSILFYRPFIDSGMPKSVSLNDIFQTHFVCGQKYQCKKAMDASKNEKKEIGSEHVVIIVITWMS